MRVGGQRAALIGPQRLALPFRRLAFGRGQPSAWHRNLDRPKRACACRKSNPGILVMQSAENWATKNVPG